MQHHVLGTDEKIQKLDENWPPQKKSRTKSVTENIGFTIGFNYFVFSYESTQTYVRVLDNRLFRVGFDCQSKSGR